MLESLQKLRGFQTEETLLGYLRAINKIFREMQTRFNYDKANPIANASFLEEICTEARHIIRRITSPEYEDSCFMWSDVNSYRPSDRSQLFRLAPSSV